ncbi:MAG: hypothetical protein RBQ72_04830, partial [Desulfobacterium sp.]|nr:hypothetical protein [Desulfobacterium sp.]
MSVENIGYSTRQVLCQKEKQIIASNVARRIPPRASVFINIGTTTEEVAKELLKKDGLRVITNNLNVAAILSQNPDIETYMAGGVVRHRDRGSRAMQPLSIVPAHTIWIGFFRNGKACEWFDITHVLADTTKHETQWGMA